MTLKIFSLFLIIAAGLCLSAEGENPKSGKQMSNPFRIPVEYLREQPEIPSFWMTTYEDVTGFLKKRVA